MKPPPFEYHAPATVADALTILAEHGDDAKVLAGGQSLMPVLNFRLARPEHLVDLNPVDTLSSLHVATDGVLVIGAMTRVAALERSVAVSKSWPLLAEAARHVGHFQIRNRGTVGGSVAHADPAAELPAALLALDAELSARSSREERTIAAGDFFVGPFMTALRSDEILTEIRVPRPGGDVHGSAFVEFARRHGDFALAGAACRLEAVGGVLSEARLALTGVAATPFRLSETEAALKRNGSSLRDVRRELTAELEATTALSDLHGSADYRLALAAEVGVRACGAALVRLRGRS